MRSKTNLPTPNLKQHSLQLITLTLSLMLFAPFIKHLIFK
jgi:hypothetical protein